MQAHVYILYMYTYMCSCLCNQHLGNSLFIPFVTCSPFVCAAGFVLYLMDLTFRLAQQMHWAPASPASKVSQDGSLATLSLRWHHVRLPFASSKCGLPCLSSSSFLALPASRVSALSAGVCLLFQQVFPCLSSRVFASQAISLVPESFLCRSSQHFLPLPTIFPRPFSRSFLAFQAGFFALSAGFLPLPAGLASLPLLLFN